MLEIIREFIVFLDDLIFLFESLPTFGMLNDVIIYDLLRELRFQKAWYSRNDPVFVELLRWSVDVRKLQAGVRFGDGPDLGFVVDRADEQVFV